MDVFLITDNLFMITYGKNITLIQDKVSADIEKKNLLTKLSTTKKLLKTTDELTNFYNKESFKASSDCTCSAVMTVDSAF